MHTTPTSNTPTPAFKYAFFGTPELAAQTLEILTNAGFPPSLVVTNADKPVGRKHELAPTPVKTWALAHHIPVWDSEDKDALLEYLQGKSAPQDLPTNDGNWDAFIVVAYGHILSESLITLPLHGTLNIHYSLLPRWRGASPVEAAILAGDETTGVTIQQMVYALDAGDIIAQSSVELAGDETATELKEVLTVVGGELLAEILPEWLNQEITPEPQDNTQVTKCGKFTKEDAEIRADMDEITKWRTYRAMIERKPYFIEDGKRNIITEASFENGTFVISEIIPEGKNRTPYHS